MVNNNNDDILNIVRDDDSTWTVGPFTLIGDEVVEKGTIELLDRPEIRYIYVREWVIIDNCSSLSDEI